jgi:elongation factor P
VSSARCISDHRSLHISFSLWVLQGDVVRFKDKLLSVLKATISAQGRGRSNLIIEWRDIRSGSKITETIIPSTKMHKIFLSRVEFEYLYSEGDGLLFMNQDSFEQVAVPSHLFDDALPFVSDGMRLHMCIDNENNVVTVEVPEKVTCTVQTTEPVLSGQAAARNSKPAVLTNGVAVSVPMFVESGHRIIVNVHERTYCGRADAE